MRAPSRRRCANCGRAFWPKPNNPTKQEYCADACYSVYMRASREDPLYAALTGARAKLGRRVLAPEVRSALATFLALEPDLTPPRPVKKRQSRHLKKKPEVRAAPALKLLPWPRLGSDGLTPLGVSFKEPGSTYEDIRRLLKSYGFRVPGLEDEDFCQIVAGTIDRRNRMPCAYDPSKSSFAHYLHILARGVMLNLLQAAKRVPELTENGELSEDATAAMAADALDAFEELPRDLRHHAANIRRYVSE